MCSPETSEHRALVLHRFELTTGDREDVFEAGSLSSEYRGNYDIIVTTLKRPFGTPRSLVSCL